MLLNRVRARLRRSDDDSERGAVLVSVIAVSAIVVIICALIASAAVNATIHSSTTRAQLQSNASAEAGVDVVWTAMQRGKFYCAKSSPAITGPQYTVTVTYYKANGVALTCTGSDDLNGTPAKAVVSSTGTALAKGVGGANSGDTRTVIAMFDLVINNHAAVLDKVFFSDGSYTVTNSTTVIDGSGLTQANLYSNTNIDCTTTVGIQGSVYVQGDFAAHNKCVIAGSVWAGGSVTSDLQLEVGGDVLSMGGTAATPSAVSLDKAWVGGSVVANGSISATNTTNSAYCPIGGYSAKVCGSVVSVEGGIALANTANIVGNAMAMKGIDLGTTNSNLIIGGNVVSTTGGLLAKNTGNSGLRVGGYVALAGSSEVPKVRIGNKASTCAILTAGVSACSPAPEIPLGGLPLALNFPTNSRVVAPPRESLPHINSTAIDFALLWSGWTVENVPCAAVPARITAGWTGKLLLNATGCTAQINMDNMSFSMPGDLVVMSPAGFTAKNDLTFASSSGTATRTLMLIVPSDAKLADGTTNLVTWTSPIATDPNYVKPVCVAGDYGDIHLAKLTTNLVETFIYTPCDFLVDNQLLNFFGQIYTGQATYPNNSSMTFVGINVPGATYGAAVPGPAVIATQTSRFDARG